MAQILTDKAMWRAVLLTVALYTCGQVASRHLWGQVGDAFTNSMPADFWGEAEASSNSTITDNNTDDDVDTTERTFYTKTLPRVVFCDFLLQLLDYQWQCWLERTFPTRPRVRVDVQQLREKEKPVERSEEVEEEIMRKLIAQGKVKRAGVNWLNTLVKWTLDNFLSVAVFGSLAGLLNRLTKFMKPAEIWEEVRYAPLMQLLGHFFSIDPLVSLIGFLIVPVQHRLPANAGIGLAFSVFFGYFAKAVVPWFLNLELVQEGIRNGTEQAKMQREWMSAQQRQAKNSSGPLRIGLDGPQTSSAVGQEL